MPGSLQVMILEDRASDAALMLAELRRAGFYVDWQRVDSEADFRAHLHPQLDVILADYSLPQFNALRALGILQENGLDIPLIVVTGAIGDEAAAECMKLGAADYVLKDRLARLGQSVTRALEPKRLRHEKRGLTAELEQRTAELEALHRIGLTVTASLNLGDVLEASLAMIAAAVGAESAGLSLMDDDRQQLRLETTTGAAPESTDLERLCNLDCLCGRCVRDLEEVVVADVTADPEVRPLACQRPGFHAFAAVPLRSNGQALGVLSLHGRARGAFDQGTLRFMRDASAFLVLALENSRLHLSVKAHADELEIRVAERTRELAAANERLMELDQLKSQFVSEVSHELRTPVSNLSLYLGLLERGKPEKHGHYLAVLKEQTARLADLIEDTLNLSRLDLARGAVAMGPVDLNSVVDQVVTAYEPRADVASLRLQMELAADLPPVRGERNQLAQVVTNLVVNAIDYTPAGEVRVATGNDTGRTYLEVADTGPGIDDDDIPHLYERFYRGRMATTSDVPGTGLGLAIVKEIVDVHGGEIQLETAVGTGTTFRVWLPVMPAGESASPESGECGAAAGDFRAAGEGQKAEGSLP